MLKLEAALRHWRAGELDEADRLCAELAGAAEPAPDAHFLRGLIAEKRNDLAGAAGHFEAAVHARGADAVFRIRLAQTLLALDRGAQARPHLERAVELTPENHANHRPLLGLLMRVLADLGDEAAVESLARAALAANPDDADALSELGFSLYRQARTEEAREQLHSLGKRNTAAAIRRALMLPHINESLEQIEAVRSRLDRELDELLAAPLERLEHPERDVGVTGFFLAYHGRNDRALLTKLARVYRKVYVTPEAAPGRSGPGKRLRIGFVSRFFYGHSISRTTHGLIRDLPRSRFEVLVFSISGKDDEWSRRIRADCDRYVALPEDLDAVRRAIDEARLDVLFFADLGMDALTYFLAFWRLAPLQLATWGHPSTSGIDSVDAFVSAVALETEGSQDQYAEELIRLPAFYQPGYRRPPMRAAPRPRAALGLPAQGPLYFVPQFLFKLHPQFDAALAAILRASPQAHLLLLAAKREAKSRVRDRIDAALGAHAPRMHFLDRMPAERFYEVLAASDVVLDPFHFGGNNTSCEAFAFGKPIVTLPAQFLRGRYTYACYREMQIDDCIASSPEDYVRIATALGHEPERREALSARIRERNHVLFERPDAVRALADVIEGRLRRT